MKKFIILGIGLVTTFGGVQAFAADLGSSETQKKRKSVLSAVRGERGDRGFKGMLDFVRDLAEDGNADMAAEIFRELRDDKARYSKAEYVQLLAELLLIARTHLDGSALKNELKEFNEIIDAYFGGASGASATIRKRLRELVKSVGKTGERDIKKLRARFKSRIATTASVARLDAAARSGAFSSGGGGGFFFGNNNNNNNNNPPFFPPFFPPLPPVSPDGS